MSYNSGKPPCKYWQQGNCRNGNRCKFAHVGPSGGGGGGQQQGGFGNSNQTQNRFGAFNGNQGGNNNYNSGGNSNYNNQSGNNNWNNNRGQGNNNYNNNRNQGGNNNWNNNRNNNQGGGYNNNRNNNQGGNNNWNNNRGQGGNNYQGGNNNQEPQKDYPATILEDLSVNLWPFSCYGPDADFPNLISGDYSFEEMRWEALKEFKTKGSLVQYNQTVANMFNEAQQKKQQAIQARQSYVPPVVQQQGGNIFGGSDHGGHAPQPAITGGIFAGIDSAPQQSGGASIFGQTQGQPSIFGGAAQTQTPSIFGGGQPQQTSSIFSTPLGAAQQAPAPSPFGLGAQSPQQTAFGMAPQQGLGSTLLPQPSFQLNPGGGQGPSPFGQSLLSGQTNLFQTTPQPQTPPQQGLMPSMGLGGPGATNLSPTPISAVPASSAVSADSLTQFRADRFTFGAIPEDEPPVEVR
jgi:hypothetical protein